MFDWLRRLTQSADDRRREQLNAYVDDELTPTERRSFERELRNDPNLQAELDQLQALKRSIRALPRQRAPRDFRLDPAVYGKPAPAPPPFALPALRTASVAFGLLFVFLIVQSLLGTTGGNFSGIAFSPEVIEVTRVVEVEAEPEIITEEVEVEITRVVEGEVVMETIIEEEVVVVVEPTQAARIAAATEIAATVAAVEAANELADDGSTADASDDDAAEVEPAPPQDEAADEAEEIAEEDEAADEVAATPTPQPTPTLMAPRPATATPTDVPRIVEVEPTATATTRPPTATPEPEPTIVPPVVEDTPVEDEAESTGLGSLLLLGSGLAFLLSLVGYIWLRRTT